MLNISSYNYQNNVVAFNGRPRCDIFKCHANCCMNAPIPESYLSKYSDKVVNPVIKQSKWEISHRKEVNKLFQ